MNLRLGDNGIISTVKDTMIKVNPQTLFEKLKILVVEQPIVVPSRKESLTVILDNANVNTEKNYFCRDLTPEMRLLHHIANKIFFQKLVDFILCVKETCA